jgi:hypothetical protein
MTRLILYMLIIIRFSSCHNKSNQLSIAVNNKDSTINTFYHEELSRLGLEALDPRDSTQHVLRFCFYGAFDSYHQFYQVNFLDSSVSYTKFHNEAHAEFRTDSLPNTTSFKLTTTDLKMLERLIEKSMIWSLETHSTGGEDYLDCAYYVYESIRPVAWAYGNGTARRILIL